MSRRIDFDSERFGARLVDDMPDIVADAVELAVYAFVADRMVRRASVHSPDIGTDWRRTLQFRVPVRCPEIWSRPEVKHALLEALTFVSEDSFEFEFTRATRSIDVERSLGFRDPRAQVIQPDLIGLFSGGLDSLAGVAGEVFGGGRTAVLVAHQSSNNIIRKQNGLAGWLRQNAGPRQLFYAPVRVGRGKAEPKEHSQRLRSFLFATLGFAYARMFERDTLQFFENGITSFNLPIAGHVVGTRASRTTHPRVLMLFSRLFSLLVNQPFKIVNPLVWKTKADVVGMIADRGWQHLIRETTSCAAVRNYAFTGVQCGVCSQCVERRFAMLARAPDQDRTSDYKTDFFRDAQEDARALAMIEGHVMRAHRLAGMTQHSFLANYGQAFRGLDGLAETAASAAGRVFALHNRYGREFIAVLNSQLSEASSFESQLALPATSLLGMVGTRQTAQPYQDSAERQRPQISVQPANGAAPSVVLGVDEKTRKIVFRAGFELGGESYRLVCRLITHHQQWCQSGAAPFVSSDTLQREFEISDDALRARVRRARRTFERGTEASWGFPPDEHDLIQSTPWTGYRLNPNVIVLELPDVKLPREDASRVSPKSVTSRKRAA